MILVYTQNQFIQVTADNHNLLSTAIWIDLLNPNKNEEKLVNKFLNIDIPSKKAMQEIEPSSRLYIDDDILFMTATMIAKSSSPELKMEAVTFILSETKLITVRYIEPHAFKLFISKLGKSNKPYDAIKILFGLLETTIDRLADILERVSHEFDKISHRIFRSNDDRGSNKINYKELLKRIGGNGDLTTRVRESLASFNRLISFLEQSLSAQLSVEMDSRLNILDKDIAALSDYAGFISTKTNFLVEATLGMVNIDQNNIIKILSVAAVIFLPPTLIASIYGMNFEYMPELRSHIGYPIAIVIMITSAILPYLYFKKRKWL